MRIDEELMDSRLGLSTASGPDYTSDKHWNDMDNIKVRIISQLINKQQKQATEYVRIQLSKYRVAHKNFPKFGVELCNTKADVSRNKYIL